MEIVAQTDYQDIYRITDGVLFIVNKFVSIDYSNETKEYIRVYTGEAKYKSYNKNCQNWLKVLKADYKYKYCSVIILKGTVLYMDIPVICINDKDKWEYEIKTTGTAFSGDYGTMLEMINNVINCMIKNRVKVKDKT
jgi:hypothetical protein|nr:MAG TPA: hypothetical protein [Caudoviricetes sp.]